MAVEVEGLNLNISADSSNIGKVASELTDLKSALSKFSVTYTKKLNTLSESVKAFSNAIGTVDTKGIADFTNAMTQLSSMKSINLGNGIAKLSKSIEELDLKRLYGQVNSLTRILEPLATTLMSIATAGELAKSALKGFTISKSLSQKLTGEITSEASTKKTKIKVPWDSIGLEKVFSLFKKISGAIAECTAKLFKFAAVRLTPIFNPFKGIATRLESINKSLKNFFSSIKRIAIYRLIRSALKEISQGLKEGIENLYQWSKVTGGDFAPAMDKITTAMLYFKNSVAAAVSPLITYFAPAIDAAIDKIVELVNVVNQFLARITGRATWTAALKYPTEYAEKAAGATKKIKDNIQSFDELHILRTPSDGGAGNALDYSKMFEEREFDDDVVKWVDEFKKAVQNGDWAEAGTILGDQINGLIDKLKWSDIGTTLANKLNGAFTFAFNLLNTVDFVGLGEGLANFCNDLISGIDAELVGQTFAKKWTAIIDTLYGFFKNFDFKEAGNKLSDFVKGWFEEIDGQMIGETLSMAIEGALDFGIEFLSDDEMIDKFVEDVVGLINGVDWYGIAVKLFTFGEKLAEAIAKVIIGIFTGESFSTTSTIQSGVPISVPKKQTFGESIGSQLADAIMSSPTDGIADAFAHILGLGLASAITVAEWAERPITNYIGGKLSDVLYGGHLDEEGNFVPYEDDPSEWKGTSIYNALDAFGNLAQNLAHAGDKEEHTWSVTWFSDVVSELEGMVEAAKGAKQGARRYFPDIKKTGVSNFSALTNSIGESSKGIISYVADTVNSMQTYLEANHINTTAKVGETATAISTKMGEAFLSVKSGTSNTFATVNSAIANTALSAKANIESIKTGSLSTFTSMAKALVTPLNSVKSAVDTAFSNTKSNVDSKVNSLTSSVVKKFGTMNTDVKSKLDTCKSDWTDKFSNEKSGITKSLTDAANATAKGIKDAFSNAKSGGVKAMEDFRDDIKEPMNDVIGFSETMGNSVAKSFNKVIDSLNSIKATTPDWLPDKKLANKTWSMSIDKIKTVEIPRLAKGGVVTSPTNALIGEAGKEAVVPLDRNTGWIDTIADRVNAGRDEEVALLREQNSYLAEIASKEFGISQRSIFDSVRRENSNYYMRTGKSVLVT